MMLYLFVGLLLNSSGAFALTEVLGDSLDQVISSVYLSDARCLSLSAIATSRITVYETITAISVIETTVPPSQSGPLATTTPEPIHPRERNGPRPWPQVITQTITSTLPAETCREATTETTKLAFASGLGDLECVTPLETVVISSSTTYYQPLCNKVVGGRYEVIAGFSTSDFGFKWVTTGISNSRDCLGACTTTTGTVINGGTTSIATIPCLYANWSTWARSSSSTPVYTKYTNTDCVLAYGSVAYIHWYDPNWLFHGNIDGDWAYSTAYTAYMAVAPATATATMAS